MAMFDIYCDFTSGICWIHLLNSWTGSRNRWPEIETVFSVQMDFGVSHPSLWNLNSRQGENSKNLVTISVRISSSKYILIATLKTNSRKSIDTNAGRKSFNTHTFLVCNFVSLKLRYT